MNITFWVTEECNLACKYCYVSKKPKTMNLAIAKKTIECFKNNFEKTVSDGNRINVAFHGGEPLLNFQVIKYIVNSMNVLYKNNLRFTMTTNGTVFDEEIFDFLINNIQISLSIDGKEQTQNANRIYKNGNGTFEVVSHTLQYLKEKGTPLRIRMTINKDTLSDMAENYIYLDSKNAGVVTFALDAGAAWSPADMLLYYKNYEKIMDYLIQKNSNNAQYFLYNVKESTFRLHTFCDGGSNTFHISADGGIYPCTYAADKEEYWLGDVSTGVLPERLKMMDEVNAQPVVGCGDCTFQKNCSSQVCKIINKHYTGNHYRASAFMCNEKDIVYRIYKKYRYILEDFHV